LAVAGWARYLATQPAEDQAFDAAGDRTRDLARQALRDPLAFLGLSEVFTAPLRSSERFRDTFATAWARIAELGPIAAMALPQ